MLSEQDSRFFVRQRMRDGALSPVSPPLEIMTRGENTRLREYYEDRAQKGIIMLDRDGVITDPKTNQITDPRIVPAIEELCADGWMVCLNSRRPVLTLREQQQKLHTNGPNYAEMGAVVDFSDPQLNWQIITDVEAYEHYAAFKQRIEQELVPSLVQEGYPIDFRTFYEQDPEDYIKSLAGTGQWPDSHLPYTIWLNNRRICGATVIACSKAMGSGGIPVMGHDVDFYDRVKNACMTLEQDGSFVQSSFLFPKGKPVMIAHADRRDKSYAWTTTLAYLGKDFLEGKEFYHIGDEDDDAINNPHVTVLTVQNGDDVVKARAKRISAFDYTIGAVDSLQAIQQGNI